MVFGKTKRSQALVGSLLCAAVFGCATEDPPSYGGQQPSGQPGGAVVMGDGGVYVPPGTGGTGGAPGVAQAGGGAQTGGAQTGGGVQIGGGAQTGGGAQPGGGPPDLGMNSQGDTFFRAEALVLKQPQLVLNVPFLGCQAVTSDVQSIVNDGLNADNNTDRIVDLSLLIRFLKTTDPKATNGEVTIGGGRCPFPLMPDGTCGPEPVFPFQAPGVAYTNGQNCMLMQTTEVAPGNCFASALTSLAINMPLLGPVPLQDGQVVGTWQDGNIVNGHVRGFLSDAVARATKLPTDLSAIPEIYRLVLTAGGPIVDHLCTTEMSKNARGEDGWWFVFDFTAKPAKFAPGVAAP
jgi:hypothetical protein